MDSYLAHVSYKEARFYTVLDPPLHKIVLLGAPSFHRLDKRNKIQLCSQSLYEINRAMDLKTTEEEWKQSILEMYHEFLDLLAAKLEEKLPPH